MTEPTTTLPASDPPPELLRRRRRMSLRAAVALGAALAVLAGVYGIGRLRSNPVVAACRPAADLAKRLSPLVHGEVAAFTVAPTPFVPPDLAFKDATGRDRSLSDWRGRTVLLNLWATWCVPCRREMPALDALQALLGGADFEVVAVNIDTRDPAKPLAFLKDISVGHLDYFADPSAKVFQDLKSADLAFGMPTTVLIDRAGCVVGSMAGPAEWASDDGVKLVSAALTRR
jgi:thiol-disulfide isomerase/thioredoxin